MEKPLELKVQDNQALFEMAQTQGWKTIIAPMLQGDINFIVNLLLKEPVPVAVEVGNGAESKIKERILEFAIKDLAAYRYAHGKCAEAKRILEKVERACRKHLGG